MGNTRRRFTAEFKAEAVRVLATSGKPVAEVSRELGINEQTLYRWKRQARSSDGNGVEPGQLTHQEEIRRLRRELDRVTEERDNLRNSAGVLCESVPVRFAFIRRHEEEFRVTRMCRVLSVTRQGNYAWKCRSPSTRALADARLLVEIRAIFERSRRSYGSPRIHSCLRRAGYRVSKKRVARLMAEAGLRAEAGARVPGHHRPATDADRP